VLFKNKKPVAAIVETTAPDGYSGAINMLVAAYFNGEIINARVLSHKETPGIGDKIDLSISNWITRFTGMYVASIEDKDFKLRKYGGKIEQFTGATITPHFLNNRLWKNNSSLVQLLGLCPVLAMTTNAINAIGLGMTTTLVLTITNTIISSFRKIIPKDLRIPIYMMIISSVVTSIEMLLHAYTFNLYQSLGIFIPLIVTNCIIVGRADLIAYKSSIVESFFDGIFIGLGSMFAMFAVGSIREILGNGTLFFGANKIISNIHSSVFFTLLDKKFTIILAVFPPGGFLILGFLIAIKNFIDLYYKKNTIKNIEQCSCSNKIK